jgi:hypothetical protein
MKQIHLYFTSFQLLRKKRVLGHAKICMHFFIFIMLDVKNIKCSVISKCVSLQNVLVLSDNFDFDWILFTGINHVFILIFNEHNDPVVIT